ncbi:hypothetical protein SDC9_125934 [bioreactor metagenome]|uniref:Uncharacterized protein n=1 Tax=bioreactor metagenome TaxID=1076179 RepID=A0A645CPT3_9ZZZZ
MYIIILCQQRHHGGTGSAIVSPQCRALCLQLAIHNFKLQRVFVKIMLYAGQLDTNHVHMPLQHQRGYFFAARGCRLFDDNIIGIVHFGIQPQPFGKIVHVLCDGFFVAGSPGNTRNFFKIAQHFCGLQPFGHILHGVTAFLLSLCFYYTCLFYWAQCKKRFFVVFCLTRPVNDKTPP